MKLSTEPQNINKRSWYYEERKGILVVHETRLSDGTYIQTDQFLIPWSKILKSVERYKAK